LTPGTDLSSNRTIGRKVDALRRLSEGGYSFRPFFFGTDFEPEMVGSTDCSAANW
jgi:hypothetical protein